MITTNVVITSIETPITMAGVAKDSGLTKLELMLGGGGVIGIVDRSVPGGIEAIFVD